MTKICKDCKHVYWGGEFPFPPLLSPTCKKGVVDCVTGKPETPCQDMRGSRGDCGSTGLLWEPKDTVTRKSFWTRLTEIF